jgi:hypothetical protein
MRSALLLFAVLVAGPVQSAPAVVRAGSNGEPCFSVDAQAERADGVAQFRAVTVVEPASGRLMWQMALPGGRSFALTHAICIPYAGRVPALPQTPAVALVAGHVYRVELAVRNGANPKAPKAYTANFCLAGKAPVLRQLDGGASCPSVP